MNRLERDIRKALRGRKESHKAFAKRLGISPAHWSQILTGIGRPSWQLADDLERALGIPAKRFLTRRLVVPQQSRPKSGHLPAQQPARDLNRADGRAQVASGAGR